MQYFVMLLLFESLFNSCWTVNDQADKFLILNEQVINRYYVYKAKRLEDDTNVVLLSNIKGDCNANRKILIDSVYILNVKMTTQIEIDDDVSLSLSRRQSVDGIEISDGINYPFLINESCNGYLITK